MIDSVRLLMRHSLVLTIILSLPSCKKDKQTIRVWIENNSTINNNLEVRTYLNDSLLDTRNIQKDSVADRVKPFEISYNSTGKILNVSFVIVGTNEKTSCSINIDSLTPRSLVHMNYVEKGFKKGDQYNNAILQTDSIIDKRFYCEIMQKR